MTAKEKKIKAQDLIMDHLSIIGYGRAWEELAGEIGQEEAEKIVKQQMDRIAKIMGYKEAWYS